MKPLLVLIISFFAALIITRFTCTDYNIPLAARIAMVIMLAFTSIAHFAFTKGMEMMIPAFIPYKKAMVYLTGIIELLAAAALLIPSLKTTIGWLLTVFFIVLLPANISAALKSVDYQKANYEGSGLLFFIAWIYFSAIKF